LPEHDIVPEAQNANAACFQSAGPLGVVSPLIG